MSQINTDLETLKTARDNMKTALEGKGQTVTKDIRTYANAIANIPAGGGGDVKLFTTKAAMDSSSGNQEGDLAVVYESSTQSVTEDTEFSNCTFPNTVVLSEAFSDNIYGSFRSTNQGSYFDGTVELSASRFRFDGRGDTRVRITYTSSDGITYTRTDGGAELQEFGTTIKWEDYGDPFNSVIGNFMKIQNSDFQGLFEYQSKTIENQYNALFEDEVLYIDYVNPEGLSDLRKTKHIIIPLTIDTNNYITSWVIYPVSTNNGASIRVDLSTNKVYLYSTKTLLAAESRYYTYQNGSYSYTDAPYNTANTNQVLYTTNNIRYITGNVDIYDTSGNKLKDAADGITFYLYDYAPSQLNLNNANQLLPGKIGYGNNGVVTGDESIYDNLDNGYILQNIYNLPQINSTLYGYNIKSIAVPNNINIPKAKGCYIKPSTYTNNALFDISNVIKTGSTNYLSNSGNYYVNNKIVYDSSTHESVRDLGQIYMLGYYNGCVLYTKEQVQPTVSSIIYKYDIDNNTEVSIGSTAAISSSYNWTYKYTHFLVLGNILICNANGENNSPKLIGASLKVCNLDTGVECVIYNHQNTISSGSNLGYSVTPILVSDNKLVIFERFKNSSGSYIYYMYDYTINTNTLLVKANATTTQLIRSSITYMYKEGYCIVDNYAIVVQDSYAYALNISQPTAMISISSDSALKTCIVNYKDGSVPYTYDSVTTRWRCVTNIIYNGATNLSFTFGDYLPFGNNCPLYTLEGTSIGLISSADAVTYTFDSVNSKYIATSKKGNIIGINMNVEPYILTTTNDASRYIIDGNADSSSSYKLLSVFDII